MKPQQKQMQDSRNCKSHQSCVEIYIFYTTESPTISLYYIGVFINLQGQIKNIGINYNHYTVPSLLSRPAAGRL